MTAKPNPLPCTCGQGGVCNRCEYDSLPLSVSMMVRVLDAAEKAALAPVIPLHEHSVRVPKDAA